MQRTWIRKIALAAVILTVLSWLFIRSVRDSIAEPYEIEEAALTGWTLSLDDPAEASVALLSLQPPEMAAASLFRQIFQRSMLSLVSPPVPAMPLVLQSEYVGGLQSAISAEEILDLARRHGLEEERLEPRCLGLREEPFAGRSRQFFFVIFDAPALQEFRRALARRHQERGGAGDFDPVALPFVLPVASSDRDLARWWPLGADIAAHCQAPVVPRPS